MPTDLPPGYRPPGQPEEPSAANWTGLLGLAIICVTVVAIVWLLTK